MSTPDDAPSLALKRAFNWGILMLSDANAKDVPELDRNSTFAATPDALVIAVRHAQDVDYEVLGLGPDDVVPLVEVSLRLTPGSHEAADFRCVLFVPSGEIRVGDAEHEDARTLAPGHYLFTVAVDDIDHAEDVDVKWSFVPEPTTL